MLTTRALLHDQTEAALASLNRRGAFAILFVDLDPMAEGGAVLLFEDIADRQIAERRSAPFPRRSE